MGNEIYVVSVYNKVNMVYKVSQEGYTTYDKALEFVKSRCGGLKQLSEFVYESDVYVYRIDVVYYAK